MEDYKKIIGERLKYLRKKKTLSGKPMPVEYITTKLDIARSTYTGWELGRRAPNGEKLVALAALFDTTVDYITGKTDDEAPSDNKLDELLANKSLKWGNKEITEEQAETIARLIQGYLNN